MADQKKQGPDRAQTGVGVAGPARRAGLETRLLPLLTEHMGRLAVEIENLRAQGAARAEGLGELSERIDQLGWSLGIACAAGGADVLMERNRSDGLELLVNLVRELLGKQPLAEALPRMTSRCPLGFAFEVAQLVWWGSPDGQPPEIRLVGEAWHLAGQWSHDPGALPPFLCGTAQLTLCSRGTWHLEIPVIWLHP